MLKHMKERKNNLKGKKINFTNKMESKTIKKESSKNYMKERTYNNLKEKKMRIYILKRSQLDMFINLYEMYTYCI